MNTQEKYFGFVRINFKWYYIGKVSGLKECFRELDSMYSAYMKTGDSFFWIEEDGELHDESGDQKIGFGYFDGAEVVTAEQFAEVSGRVVFGHEGIAALCACDLEDEEFDLISLSDFDARALFHLAMKIYDQSGKFTDKQLYHLGIGIGEWASNTAGMMGSYSSVEEIRDEVAQFVADDAKYYDEMQEDN